MKKVLQFAVAIVMSIGLTAGVAAADSGFTYGCADIIASGPGSDNYAYCQAHQNETLVCNNQLNLKNTNNQSAESGSASSSGNTTSSSSSSGDADNTNATDVNVSTGCTVQTVAATNTPTPAMPTAGGMGGGVVTTPTTTSPSGGQGASLPDTGSSTVLRSTALGLGTVTALGLVSQAGIRTYRRLALK